MTQYRLVDKETGFVLHPGPFNDSIEAMKAAGYPRSSRIAAEPIPEKKEEEK